MSALSTFGSKLSSPLSRELESRWEQFSSVVRRPQNRCQAVTWKSGHRVDLKPSPWEAQQ